jgi:coproporphyrinogen III oxidase
MGLEPTRHRHTHLKRACLPIPALPHKAMPWHCKKYFSIPAAKKQGLFGLFFKLLTTVPSRAKIVRYTASFTLFSRIAAKNFNFFQNRACIFAQALIY